MKRRSGQRERVPLALLHPRYAPTWLGIGFFWLVTQWPRTMRHAFGKLLGRVAWRRNRKRRHIIDANLQHCFPHWTQAQRDAVNRAHFEAMGRSLMDVGLIWFSSIRRLRRLEALEGWEHCEQARDQGKNIIFHVAHSAGLDFGALSVSLRETGVGPYNALKNPVVDWWVRHGRRRFGSEVFDREAGMLVYTRALRRGTLLYTLSDEDHGPALSVFAPFYGQPKATLPMVGRLAKLSHAAVLPLMTYYDANRHVYVTRIFPALSEFPSDDPVKNATKLNQALEQMIDLAPEEYMWTLRLFKTQADRQNIYKNF